MEIFRMILLINVKIVKFNKSITMHEIPYEDRMNYEFIDKQNFKKRIAEFKKHFQYIIINKWKSLNRVADANF